MVKVDEVVSVQLLSVVPVVLVAAISGVVYNCSFCSRVTVSWCKWCSRRKSIGTNGVLATDGVIDIIT